MLRKGSVLLFAAAGNLSEGYNQTFHTAIRSLALSQLPIEKLNIFNDRRLQSCSLACNFPRIIEVTINQLFGHSHLSINTKRRLFI
jgi:hypothetical protein